MLEACDELLIRALCPNFKILLHEIGEERGAYWKIFTEQIDSVEVTDSFTAAVKSRFPLPKKANYQPSEQTLSSRPSVVSSPTGSLNEVSVPIQYVQDWNEAYYSYCAMQRFHSIHAAICLIDVSLHSSDWERLIDRFREQMAVQQKVSAQVRIVLFNVPADFSGTISDGVIFIPHSSAPSRVLLYLTNLVCDILALAKRKFVELLESNQFRPGEIMFSPGTLFESISTLEGLQRMKKISEARRYKVIGDWLYLFGSFQLSLAYYKIANAELKKYEDTNWVALLKEAVCVCQLKLHLQNADCQGMKEAVGGAIDRFKKFQQIFEHQKAHFFSCYFLRLLCVSYLAIGCSSLAVQCLCRLFDIACDSLSEKRERIFFMAFCANAFNTCGLHRKFAFANWQLGQLEEALRISLLNSALLVADGDEPAKWRPMLVRFGLVAEILSAQNDGFIVDSVVIAYFRMHQFCEFYSLMSENEQSAAYSRLSSFYDQDEKENFFPAPPIVKTAALAGCDGLVSDGSCSVENSPSSLFLYTPVSPTAPRIAERKFVVYGEDYEISLCFWNPFSIEIGICNISLSGTGFQSPSLVGQRLLAPLRNSYISLPLKITSCTSFVVEGVLFSFCFARYSVSIESISFPVLPEFPLLVSVPNLQPSGQPVEPSVFEGAPATLSFALFNTSSVAATISQVRVFFENTPAPLTIMNPSLQRKIEPHAGLALSFETPLLCSNLKATVNYESSERGFFRSVSRSFYVAILPSIQVTNFAVAPFIQRQLTDEPQVKIILRVKNHFQQCRIFVEKPITTSMAVDQSEIVSFVMDLSLLQQTADKSGYISDQFLMKWKYREYEGLISLPKSENLCSLGKAMFFLWGSADMLEVQTWNVPAELFPLVVRIESSQLEYSMNDNYARLPVGSFPTTVLILSETTIVHQETVNK